MSEGRFSRDRIESWLQCYFCSGWAFLIPYLAVYLLYAALKWPANQGTAAMAVLRPPALLHLYWLLHAAHFILAGLALYLCRRKLAVLLPLAAVPGFIIPWICLALVFWIPGLSLEWPSDPWEHLRRINEWHGCALVTDHTAWMKSSYMLLYSLTGHSTGPTQLSWLNVCSAGISLLLCWQYYGLARTVGLGERASWIFVLLQALTLGNSIFSFYRYYGLSSSIFAQIAAIALIRLALAFAREFPAGINRLPSVLGCAMLLLVFAAFNHPQSLGLAALGLAAIVTWRLLEWKRASGWPLFALAILTSVATLWWYPRDPTINGTLRTEGWLSPWYGFNLLSFESPANRRMLQIIGSAGLVNLVAGLLLVRRNHVVGWLTVMPVVALCLPCVAIPFATYLVSHGGEGHYILTFHRLFLAIPSGLALVVLGDRFFGYQKRPSSNVASPPISAGFPFLLASLAAFTVVFSGGPSYNRLWHSLARTPDDLGVKHVISAAGTLLDKDAMPAPRLLTTAGIGFVLKSMGLRNVPLAQRDIAAAVDLSAIYVTLSIGDLRYPDSLLYSPPGTMLYTPLSLAGSLSGHWPRSRVALDHATTQEIHTAAANVGWTGREFLHRPAADNE